MRVMLHLAPPYFPTRFTSVLVRLSPRCCRFPRSLPQKTLFFARFAFTALSSLFLCVSLFTRAAGRACPSFPMPLNALSASFAPLNPRPGLCARFLCQSPLTHFLPPPCSVQTARWLVVRLPPFCPGTRLRLRKDLRVPPCAKKSPEHTVNALFPPQFSSFRAVSPSPLSPSSVSFRRAFPPREIGLSNLPTPFPSNIRPSSLCWFLASAVSALLCGRLPLPVRPRVLCALRLIRCRRQPFRNSPSNASLCRSLCRIRRIPGPAPIFTSSLRFTPLFPPFFHAIHVCLAHSSFPRHCRPKTTQFSPRTDSLHSILHLTHPQPLRSHAPFDLRRPHSSSHSAFCTSFPRPGAFSPARSLVLKSRHQTCLYCLRCRHNTTP
ncbi:hypothetical protein, conserved in T. vivax, partial [Trypanosoma vivax Y486]